MINSMKQLLIHQLKDLYDGEHQLLEALPTMIKQATNKRLIEVLEEHYEETQTQVMRLEEIFDHLSEEPERKTCQAMKGLITEANQAIKEAGYKTTRDLSIVAQGLRIEYYEMAGYFVAVRLADSMEYDEVYDLLNETLDEEENAADSLENFLETSFFNTIQESLGGEDNTLV